MKKYHRSAAGNQNPVPSIVRPAEVLVDTFNYLLEGIVGYCSIPPLLRCPPSPDAVSGLAALASPPAAFQPHDRDFSTVYQFVRDRMRAIQQDFTVQSSDRSDAAVDVHERMVRFLIMADHFLCGKKPPIYDWKLSSDQLSNCLSTLKDLYFDNRQIGYHCPNEAEFQGYRALFFLGESDAMKSLFQLPYSISNSEPVQLALQLHKYYVSDDYIHFFRMIKDPRTPFLFASFAQHAFYHVRYRALRVMKRAYKFYEVDDLVDLLGFNENKDALDFLLEHGYVVCTFCSIFPLLLDPLHFSFLLSHSLI